MKIICPGMLAVTMLLAAQPAKADSTDNDSITVTIDETEWEGNLTVTIPIQSSSGIRDVMVEEGKSATTVYSLQGIRRRTSQPQAPLDRLPKGVYIIGGKKIVK